MTKYDEHFRLKVVQHYLSGADSLQGTSKHFQVGQGAVQRWISGYKVHGVAGLRKKHNYYTADFKLAVLKHMWDTGLSRNQTVILYDLRDPGSVARWERMYRDGGMDALRATSRKNYAYMDIPPGAKPQPLTDDEQRSREALLAELNHLRMENEYLKKLKALVQAQQNNAASNGRK